MTDVSSRERTLASHESEREEGRHCRQAGGVISVGITGSRLDGSRERLHCLLNWLG